MRNLLYAITILLGIILISSIHSCSSVDEDYLDCPTWPDGTKQGNGSDTTIVNRNDTVFIYSNKTVILWDTIKNINRDTIYFETSDPLATEIIDTVKSEYMDEVRVEDVIKRFVEPDSLFVTNIDSLFRTVLINLDINHQIPTLVNPPIEGADITIYLNLFKFEKAYGQIETNGDRYLNFYGYQRGAHVRISDLSSVLYGSGFITTESAIHEANQNSYSSIDENLYYDHIRAIWIWVFNKETESFMIEMQSISWTNTPSAKERFFTPEFTIKEEGKQLWMEIDGKTIAFVAKLTEP